MSATNRGAVRSPDDFYRTPSWTVDAILPHIPNCGYLLDPCCGDGAILDAVRLSAASDTIDEWSGIELDQPRAEAARAAGHAVECRDALDCINWSRPSVVLMNPPFSLAIEFVKRALVETRAGGTVAALLRLNWLEGIARQPFHRKHPADVYVLPRRPSFTGKGTDATAYAWFVYGPGRGGRWFVLDV